MNSPTNLTHRQGVEPHELVSGEFMYEVNGSHEPETFWVFPPDFDTVLRIPLVAVGAEKPWTLAGPAAYPTITPSISADGGERGTKTHGFVTDGAWIPA